MELFQSLCINPLSDLNKYQKVRVLGSGGFGKVYLLQLPNATDFTKGNDTQARFSTNGGKKCLPRNIGNGIRNSRAVRITK